MPPTRRAALVVIGSASPNRVLLQFIFGQRHGFFGDFFTSAAVSAKRKKPIGRVKYVVAAPRMVG